MLATKLGTLSFFAPAFDHGPIGAALFTLAAAFGMMNLLAVVAEWRVLWPSQQYASFYKGDSVGLTIIMGSLVAMGAGMPAGRHFYQLGWWQWGWLGIGLIVGLAMSANEYVSGAYDWRTMISPTKVYHNCVVFPVLIYLIFANGLPIMIYSHSGPTAAVTGNRGSIFAMIVLVLATAYYVRLLWRDITNPNPQGRLAHVPIRPMEGLLGLGVLATAGAGALLGAQHPQTLSLFSLGLLVAAVAIYFTCFAKDVIQPAVLPWAHVPWTPRYLLGYIRKSMRPPWPYDTRLQASPHASRPQHARGP